MDFCPLLGSLSTMSGTGGDNLNVDKTLFVVSDGPKSDGNSLAPVQSEPQQDSDERVPFTSDWTPSTPSLPIAVYAVIVFGVVAACITLIFTVTGDGNEAAASGQDEAVDALEQDTSPAAPATQLPSSLGNSATSSTTVTQEATATDGGQTSRTSPTTGPDIIRPNTAPTPTLPVPSEILTTTTPTNQPADNTASTSVQTTTTTASTTTSERITTTTEATTTTSRPTTTQATTTTTRPTTTISEALPLRRTDFQVRPTFLVVVYNVASEEFCFDSWTYELRNDDGDLEITRSGTVNENRCVRWHGIPIDTVNLNSGDTYTIDLTALSDEGKTAVITEQVTIP